MAQRRLCQYYAKAVGRSCLTPLIGIRGGIAGDFTVTRVAEDEFIIIGSGMAERYHQRFWKMVPMPEAVRFESQTEALCGFNVAGPKSRELLQRLTNTSLATGDFPFMRSKRIELAGVDCLALRVSFTGDLAGSCIVKPKTSCGSMRPYWTARKSLTQAPLARGL